ncbi:MULTISPECIES: ABC transporter permease [unclassified Leptolyngbya]|uniref:ABC transporter permease n=1 Tax=unclassified Leptolyngbya TaxID=2650499 RepID=UPI00168605E3|nr:MULTISPECIES: ABC transporter permease [unclassified Leptolyngbya]MBD1913157.1 ABC transporter permease [Leptolyngbya sp. FACHB-8]MBD2158804.1 ABC transporter permease [Leptolyngbya sp. FACHB-16]
MQLNRRPLPLLLQLFDLLCMELSNWRWSWQVMVLTATISPVLSIIALGSFVTRNDAESLHAILAGSLVMSLMFGNLDNVSSRFAYMRFSGALDYYATLPIRRSLLMVAVVLAFFVLSLPSLLVTIVFGAWFLHLSLTIHPLILLIIPLCVLPLAGVGAAIGANSPSPEVGGGLTLLVTMLALFVGPVLLPASRLPEIVQTIGYFSPATYAASALKQTLLEPMTQRVVIDLVALIGFSVLTFWLVSRKLK